jgi:hypothetical protein
MRRLSTGLCASQRTPLSSVQADIPIELVMNPLFRRLPVGQIVVYLALGFGSVAKAVSPIGAEARQFDFAVGEWSVESLDGRVCGSVKIEAVADGAGLSARWTDARTAEGAEHSLLAWSAETREWRQLRVTKSGVVADLNGRWKNGSMVFEGTRRDADRNVLERVTWTPVGDNSIRQLKEESSDGARSWRPLFDLVYRRVNAQIATAAEIPKAFRYLLW